MISITMCVGLSFFFFFGFVSAVTGCASTSVFVSLVGVSVDIKSKSQLSRERGKHNKTVLLAKAKFCFNKWCKYDIIIIRWKKKSKILKMLWNAIYKSN